MSAGMSSTGRPPVTTRRVLAAAALQLFLSDGFDETSVDDIAAAAGVSRRTFFRYFPSKSAVLWHELDDEVRVLRELLAHADDTAPMMQVVRASVVAINRGRGSDEMRELRARTELINAVPSLQAAAALHYGDWVRAVSDFVAGRLGVAQQSLFPVAVGRSVLASAFAAYELWRDRGDRTLSSYLDEALGALADGFGEDGLRHRTRARPFTRRRPRA